MTDLNFRTHLQQIAADRDKAIASEEAVRAATLVEQIKKVVEEKATAFGGDYCVFRFPDIAPRSVRALAVRRLMQPPNNLSCYKREAEYGQELVLVWTQGFVPANTTPYFD